MKLNIFTIVLDGMPWITQHIQVFNRLKCDWTWHIVEGTSAARHDTAWMKIKTSGLSTDGTSHYLDSLAGTHPRVKLYRKPLWDGKREMVNAPLDKIINQSVLLEIDSDEIWTTDQIDKIVTIFDQDNDLSLMRFKCNFFVGPNLVTIGEDCYGCQTYEWIRAWRFNPGMRFTRHEPPDLSGNQGKCMGRNETASLGLVFDHMSYVVESQVQIKESTYGYAQAVRFWKNMQANRMWPQKLKAYFKWADDKVQVDCFHK